MIDKLLVTQITARALSAAEIREKGIVFDPSNFQAYNFTAAFALKSGEPINVNFPVVLPSVQGAAGTSTTVETIGGIRPPTIASLKTVIPDTLKLATQIPNLTVLGFQLEVPALKGQDLLRPADPRRHRHTGRHRVPEPVLQRDADGRQCRPCRIWPQRHRPPGPNHPAAGERPGGWFHRRPAAHGDDRPR